MSDERDGIIAARLESPISNLPSPNSNLASAPQFPSTVRSTIALASPVVVP